MTSRAGVAIVVVSRGLPVAVAEVDDALARSQGRWFRWVTLLQEHVWRQREGSLATI